MTKTFTEQGLAGLKSILIESRKEGYLADNVDIELVTMVFFQTSGMLMREYNIMLPRALLGRMHMVAWQSISCVEFRL